MLFVVNFDEFDNDSYVEDLLQLEPKSVHNIKRVYFDGDGDGGAAFQVSATIPEGEWQRIKANFDAAEKPGDTVHQTELKVRWGLTPRLIKLLGEPDRKTGSRRHRGTTVNLWNIDRVSDFIKEHREDLTEIAKGRAKRSEAGKKRRAQKDAEDLEWVKTVDLGCQFTDLGELTAMEGSLADPHVYDVNVGGYGALLLVARDNFTAFADIRSRFKTMRRENKNVFFRRLADAICTHYGLEPIEDGELFRLNDEGAYKVDPKDRTKDGWKKGFMR